jgi:IS30 family transposase
MASKASLRAIAKDLGRSHATVSREMRRNRARDGYWPAQAQQRAEQRRRERPLSRRMDDPEVNEYVRIHLAKSWSPEQIAGRHRKQLSATRAKHVSHETIYLWTRNSPHRPHWEQFLGRAGRGNDLEKRGKIPQRLDIAGRPKIVSTRSRFGDWEGDTLLATAAAAAW